MKANTPTERRLARCPAPSSLAGLKPVADPGGRVPYPGVLTMIDIDPRVNLSATARTALAIAATRSDYLVRPPQLPIAAARQVVRSLLRRGLVEEVGALIQDATYAWRTNHDGTALMLRATAFGLAQVGHQTDDYLC